VTDSVATKKCPYCTETIKAEATVCRFCGRTIESPTSNVALLIIGIFAIVSAIVVNIMAKPGFEEHVGNSNATAAYYGSFVIGALGLFLVITAILRSR
jgi:hypothetical protein